MTFKQNSTEIRTNDLGDSIYYFFFEMLKFPMFLTDHASSAMSDWRTLADQLCGSQWEGLQVRTVSIILLLRIIKAVITQLFLYLYPAYDTMHLFLIFQACDDQDHAHAQVRLHCQDASERGAWNPRVQLTPGTPHTPHTHTPATHACHALFAHAWRMHYTHARRTCRLHGLHAHTRMPHTHCVHTLFKRTFIFSMNFLQIFSSFCFFPSPVILFAFFFFYNNAN